MSWTSASAPPLGLPSPDFDVVGGIQAAIKYSHIGEEWIAVVLVSVRIRMSGLSPFVDTSRARLISSVEDLRPWIFLTWITIGAFCVAVVVRRCLCGCPFKFRLGSVVTGRLLNTSSWGGLAICTSS